MSESSYDNNGQYSRHSILRYEKIFGKGFVSTGGLPIVEHFCTTLELPQGARILDIGSGLGGAAFYLAERYQAEVIGIDLSQMMLDIASERSAENTQFNTQFVHANVLELDYPEGHFDLIWSRDALLHIFEKETLFSHVYKWLKPGGQVLLSDYSRSAEPKTEAFQSYVQKSGYHLLDVDTYAQLLKDAGLTDVSGEDWTPLFIETLQKEMKLLQDNRSSFLADFSEEDLNYLIARWESKVEYCHTGDMRVGVWRGRKAL